MKSLILSFTRLLCLLALMFVIVSKANAQQFFTYSQYMNNLTPINPTYSLIDKNGSLNALLRKQWAGIQGSPSTFIFNASFPIEQQNAAAGAIVMNDQFAVEHLTEVNAFYAKGIQLSEKLTLGVSLNAGLRHYVANYSSLDATDPVFRDDIRQSKPNFGFGVMLFSDKYYVGLSVPELTVTTLGTASVQGNTYFRNHYNFSAAYIIDGGTDLKVKPAILGTYTKTLPFIADISTTFYLKNMVGVGVNYRTNSEMSGIISFALQNFKLGYSYQFGSSSTNIGGIGFNNATHEITLAYRFGQHLEDINLL